MNKIFVLFLVLLFQSALAYDFQSTEKIPVRIRLEKKISSEKDYYEGERVNFKIDRDVFYSNSCILHQNDTISARVQVIITAGMNGIPASIIFDDFEIENIPKEKLTPSLEIFGQDRSLFVFPLKWALTPLPPTGSLTNFIKGGRVRASTNKIFTIYLQIDNWLDYYNIK